MAPPTTGPITGQAADGAPSSEPPLTFLFTDVENSTRLWEQNPLAMRSALAQHDNIVRSAISDSGGDVVKTTGDGLMAVFEAPVQAVTASIAAQRGLLAAKWPQACAIRIRIGIHTGEAEPRGGDYFGPAVNRTARDHAAGRGSQVLCPTRPGVAVAASCRTASRCAIWVSIAQLTWDGRNGSSRSRTRSCRRSSRRSPRSTSGRTTSRPRRRGSSVATPSSRRSASASTTTMSASSR